MKKWLISIFLLNIIGSPISLLATPDGGISIKEVLIAYNESCYYVMKYQKERPPQYGVWTELLYLVKYSIETNTQIEAIKLREANINDGFGSGTGELTIKDIDDASFDINKYLRDQKIISPDFPYAAKDFGYSIGMNGVYLETSGIQECVFPVRMIEEKVSEYVDEPWNFSPPDSDENPFVSNVYVEALYGKGEYHFLEINTNSVFGCQFILARRALKANK